MTLPSKYKEPPTWKAWMKMQPEFLDVIRSYVHEKHVVDLGAGNGVGAHWMLYLGASKVTMVDKEDMSDIVDPPYMEGVCTPFHKVPGDVGGDVALIGWPTTSCSHLHSILHRWPVLVVFAKNSDHTACGDDLLWLYLSSREILQYVPHKSNSLTIYGPSHMERELTGLEVSGIAGQSVSFEYESEFHEIL